MLNIDQFYLIQVSYNSSMFLRKPSSISVFCFDSDQMEEKKRAISHKVVLAREGALLK